MKPSERLLEMLRGAAGLDIPEGARLVRAPGAYRGTSRTEGAWVWTVAHADGTPVYKDSEGRPMAIGSQFTMSELIRTGIQVSDRDQNGDIYIDPPEGAAR